MITMKITRRQLRKLINESIYGNPDYYKPRVPNPVDHLSDEDREDLEVLLTHEDEEMRRVGYDQATQHQQDELIFPEEGDPYEEPYYKGYDYLYDTKDKKDISDLLGLQYNLKGAYNEFNRASADKKWLRIGSPESNKRMAMNRKVNKAFQAALKHAAKVAAGREPRPHRDKVFEELFGDYLPDNLNIKDEIKERDRFYDLDQYMAGLR